MQETTENTAAENTVIVLGCHIHGYLDRDHYYTVENTHTGRILCSTPYRTDYEETIRDLVQGGYSVID